jgi:hypothetical protein
VVFTNDVVDDHNDNAIVVGDTVFINGDFINYLAPTSAGATASIRAIAGGGYVTPIDTTTNLGTIATLATTNNNADPFTFKVNPGTPLNSVVTLRVLIQDGSYWDMYYVDITVNVDYINVAINDVATTITSKGKIGWNQDMTTEGLGFSYLGTQMMYEGGLMIGTNTTTVSDCVRGSNGTTSDADFQSAINVSRVAPAVVSEFDIHGAFNDMPAVPTQNLYVTHNAYAWSTPGNTKYVIVQYIIRNDGSTPLSSLYAGISADWDIDATTYGDDKSDYDAVRNMGYSWCTDLNGKFAGIKLLTQSAPPVFYAIDNVTGGGGGLDITDADFYSTADKYMALSTNRLQGGNTVATGNDVMNVMSSGPFNIAAGDSVVVAFALIGGDDLGDLQESADSAQVHYDGAFPVGLMKIVQSAGDVKIYPNPASNSLTITMQDAEGGPVTISLTNMMGGTVKSLTFDNTVVGYNKFTLDLSDVADGAYTWKVLNDKGKQTVGKLIVTKSGK